MLLERLIGGQLGRGLAVVGDPRAGIGEHDERQARVAGVRLAADDADALERLQLPGDARRGDPEPVRELDAAQALTGRVAQLEQDRQVAEADAVVCAEGCVDVAQHERAREREVENGGEGWLMSVSCQQHIIE